MTECPEMTATEMQAFLAAQKHAMEEHKWIESEKVGHDLGQACLLEWVKEHAEGFRRDYNERKAREMAERTEKAEVG